ncbi:MAG: helix-turn-helix domain-containing protein [Nanoarchaeota archaeon]|nr:helix-turn-helix domain-containing protein [Nanoarchaeota archaeon]
MANFRRILQEHTKKINKERNRLIIKEHKKGVSEEDIAKMFKVHYSTIQVIIKDFKKKNGR